MATRNRVEISVSSVTTKCASVRDCEPEYCEPERVNLNVSLNAQIAMNVREGESEGERKKKKEIQSENRKSGWTSERDLRACVLLSKDRAIFQNFTRHA